MAFELAGVNVGMDGQSSRIQLTVFDGENSGDHQHSSEVLIAEVSAKPFMIFVWVGAACVLAGLLHAGANRLKEYSLTRSMGG
jgi:hypothetical protein